MYWTLFVVRCAIESILRCYYILIRYAVNIFGTTLIWWFWLEPKRKASRGKANERMDIIIFSLAEQLTFDERSSNRSFCSLFLSLSQQQIDDYYNHFRINDNNTPTELNRESAVFLSLNWFWSAFWCVSETRDKSEWCSFCSLQSGILMLVYIWHITSPPARERVKKRRLSKRKQKKFWIIEFYYR